MPPRLLTGATLLFWGGMTSHAVLALIAALMLEARSWISLRWNFNQTTYVRSWHYSILCGALISILAWMNGMKIGKLHTLFLWAPMVLLPIELAMRYGKAKTIPLNTFSFFARKKMEQDLKHGRLIEPRMINTGYIYIAVTLLATAMGSRHELHHMIGLSVIISVILLFNGKETGFRPWAWGLSIIMVVTLSLLGQWGLFKLYNHYRGTHGNGDEYGRQISANETRTSIGRLGRLKLSPQIFWRMQVNDGNAPKLMRVATYNQYARATWKYQFKLTDDEALRDKDGYLQSDDASPSDDEDIRIFTGNNTAEANTPRALPSFPETANLRIVGEVSTKVNSNPIPMPHFMHAIGDIRNLGLETSIESNTLGTVRLTNPDYSVIEYLVWIGDSSTTDSKVLKEDLNIPPIERPAIQRICASLGLKGKKLSTTQKINILRRFFLNNFKYSTHFTTPGIKKNNRNTAVGNFLESTRTGHCEYFATATALLLREAGVPTRYCVGFSVSELDTQSKEWLLRGKHAHAWCRVWIEETPHENAHWEDVDLTPPSWENMEEANTSHWQRQLADWWQILREDFLIWRTHESNKTAVITTITVIISLLTLWILWRLWKSRQPNQQSKHVPYHLLLNPPLTSLNQLEPKLAKVLGPRPVGIPLSQWLPEILDLESDLDELINSIIQYHDTARFDPLGISGEQEKELNHLCIRLKSHLRKLRKNHS